MGKGWLRPRCTPPSGMVGAAALALVAWSAASTSLARTCRVVSGPAGRETIVELTILNPPGDVTLTPTTPCSQMFDLSGVWSINGPQSIFDVYIVLDHSKTTRDDSGIDVDGDGNFGETSPGRGGDDDVYHAELAAAKAFVRAVDPNIARVAIVRFSDFASTELFLPLTSNMALAENVIDSMYGDVPDYETRPVYAMDEVDDEVIRNGDRFNRAQICLFLSDGEFDDTYTAIQNKAERLDLLGVVIHTFHLGSQYPATGLQLMSDITGGTLTELAVPGEIVNVLPDMVPVGPGAFTVTNDLTGQGTANLDLDSGSFTARVEVVPGTNRVTLSLGTSASPPVTVQCSIDVELPPTLVANAGPGYDACEGARVLLDAGGSIYETCPNPQFYWYDCTGALICGPSSDPTCGITACGTTCRAFRLELRCPGYPCFSQAMTRVDCIPSVRPSPSLAGACGLEAHLTCGTSAASTWWDLDATTDSDGNTDPTDDRDAVGCDVTATYTRLGLQQVVAWAHDDVLGCDIPFDLAFELTPLPPPRNLDGGVCPTQPADFSCGTPASGSTYWWDFKGAIDSDGDTDPTRDHDADGCDTSVTWSTPGVHEVRCWEIDEFGCTKLVAFGTIVVGEGAIPGEVPDVLLSRDGDAVDLRWGGVPGASSYRVSRGTIARFFSSRDYDHSADNAQGQGTCDTGASRTFHDWDDAVTPGSFYYLVTSTIACGGEGLPGNAWNKVDYIPRPARIPSPDCP